MEVSIWPKICRAKTLFPDVDECVADPCGKHTECTNVPGSFECVCNSGFKTKTCIETDGNCSRTGAEASGSSGDDKLNGMILCEGNTCYHMFVSTDIGLV